MLPGAIGISVVLVSVEVVVDIVDDLNVIDVYEEVSTSALDDNEDDDVVVDMVVEVMVDDAVILSVVIVDVGDNVDDAVFVVDFEVIGGEDDDAFM